MSETFVTHIRNGFLLDSSDVYHGYTLAEWYVIVPLLILPTILLFMLDTRADHQFRCI